MRVTVHLPAGWRAVTQGRRLARQETGQGARERWEEPRPQEAIHVAAGPWHEFALTKGRVPVFAFLRAPDGELAGRYMETAQDYLYAVFHGAEAVNVARGRWPVVDSPMSVPVAQLEGSRPPAGSVSPNPPPRLTDLLDGKP